jgi:predicted nucleotidyltransferase
MERELTELVERKVDLRTPNDLSPYFREAVLGWGEELQRRVRTK